MKLTSLFQIVDKLQQAGKIDNLQPVCSVFGCVVITVVLLLTSSFLNLSFKVTPNIIRCILISVVCNFLFFPFPLAHSRTIRHHWPDHCSVYPCFYSHQLPFVVQNCFYLSPFLPASTYSCLYLLFTVSFSDPKYLKFFICFSSSPCMSLMFTCFSPVLLHTVVSVFFTFIFTPYFSRLSCHFSYNRNVMHLQKAALTLLSCS